MLTHGITDQKSE